MGLGAWRQVHGGRAGHERHGHGMARYGMAWSGRSGSAAACPCPWPLAAPIHPFRSCGICKHVLRELEAVCRESRQQRARIVFLKHDMQVGCCAGMAAQGGCSLGAQAGSCAARAWAMWVGTRWPSKRRRHAVASGPQAMRRCARTDACPCPHEPPSPAPPAAPLAGFLNQQDAFDWPSDISRMYKIRSSPRFLFFVDVRPTGFEEGSRALRHAIASCSN